VVSGCLVIRSKLCTATPAAPLIRLSRHARSSPQIRADAEHANVQVIQTAKKRAQSAFRRQPKPPGGGPGGCSAIGAGRQKKPGGRRPTPGRCAACQPQSVATRSAPSPNARVATAPLHMGVHGEVLPAPLAVAKLLGRAKGFDRLRARDQLLREAADSSRDQSSGPAGGATLHANCPL